VKRFIYTSSVAVYGDAEVPYSEDDICKPKDVYGVNKFACESILKILAKVHNLDYTIFRPHNIYGPHQDMSNPYKNVVALMMRNIMEGKEITLYGEGKMRRAFSYVNDVVDILQAALQDNFRNQVVNVGSSLDVEVGQVLEMIEAVSGQKARIVHKPARPQEIWNFLPCHNKLRLLYPYHETPLEEGLRRTWEFINLPSVVKENNEI
jgi:UDP-glucose 4-epimerase